MHIKDSVLQLKNKQTKNPVFGVWRSPGLFSSVANWIWNFAFDPFGIHVFSLCVELDITK